jgi:hypothetical protein
MDLLGTVMFLLMSAAFIRRQRQIVRMAGAYTRSDFRST